MIVGTGPEKLNLEKKTAGLNVSHRVIFTGNLDNPFPLISKASALIITSEYEGFSNSVLEAMFCNVPVITSLCSSDAVDMCNIGAAIGYDVGDYEQLTKHMIDILNNPAISDVVVKIAKKYRSIHSINKAIPFYERLLTNLF